MPYKDPEKDRAYRDKYNADLRAKTLYKRANRQPHPIWDNPDLIKKAVEETESMGQALQVLGFKTNNGMYRVLKQKAAIYKITLKKGSALNVEVRRMQNRIPNDLWFTVDTERQGSRSLQRLIEEGTAFECVLCSQLPIWNNLPLTLQLDHIDGNSTNNVRENLRILCPNCHTQTETYGNKKAKTNGV